MKKHAVMASLVVALTIFVGIDSMGYTGSTSYIASAFAWIKHQLGYGAPARVQEESPVKKLASSKGFFELLEEGPQSKRTRRNDLTRRQRSTASSYEKLGRSYEENALLAEQNRVLRSTGQEVYLLPSLEQLKKVKVCPPFAGLVVEPLYYELSNDHLESAYTPIPLLDDVNNVRCFISSDYKGYQLEFYQLRTINQTMKVDGEQIFVDTCGALALFAAEKMSNYARTGDAGILRSLYDVAQARLKAEQCYYPKSGQLSPHSSQLSRQKRELKKERLYSEQVKFLLESSPDFQSENDQAHIAILESPQNIVGGGVEASGAWDFNREPMRQALAAGLRQDSFYYNWIMGNEDEVDLGQRGGHWYCVTLLKSGKKLQFIVIDSLAHYHLQPGSYDYKRLVTFANTIIDTWLK